VQRGSNIYKQQVIDRKKHSYYEHSAEGT